MRNLRQLESRIVALELRLKIVDDPTIERRRYKKLLRESKRLRKIAIAQRRALLRDMENEDLLQQELQDTRIVLDACRNDPSLSIVDAFNARIKIRKSKSN